MEEEYNDSISGGMSDDDLLMREVVKEEADLLYLDSYLGEILKVGY